MYRSGLANTILPHSTRKIFPLFSHFLQDRKRKNPTVPTVFRFSKLPFQKLALRRMHKRRPKRKIRLRKAASCKAARGQKSFPQLSTDFNTTTTTTLTDTLNIYFSFSLSFTSCAKVYVVFSANRHQITGRRYFAKGEKSLAPQAFSPMTP